MHERALKITGERRRSGLGWVVGWGEEGGGFLGLVVSSCDDGKAMTHIPTYLPTFEQVCVCPCRLM